VPPELAPAARQPRSATCSRTLGLGFFSHEQASAIQASAHHLGDHYFFDRYTGNPTRLFRIFNYPTAMPDW
jgi:hypothetical protein